MLMVFAMTWLFSKIIQTHKPLQVNRKCSFECEMSERLMWQTTVWKLNTWSDQTFHCVCLGGCMHMRMRWRGSSHVWTVNLLRLTYTLDAKKTDLEQRNTPVSILQSKTIQRKSMGATCSRLTKLLSDHKTNCVSSFKG